MISALHALPGMSSPGPGHAPPCPSDALAQRFQDLVQLPPAEEDAQIDDAAGPDTDTDSQAQALDSQVLSGLVAATGLNHTDPESEDE